METKYEYLGYTLRLEPERTTVSPIEYELTGDKAVRDFLIEVCKLHQKASEELIVIATNAKGGVIGWHRAAIGGVRSIPIDPREIFKFAITANAVQIILAHNHLSEDVTPSEDDRTTTKRLVEVGTLIGIPVIDHVIVGMGQEHFSFMKESTLQRDRNESGL